MVNWPSACVACGTAENLTQKHHTFTKNVTEDYESHQESKSYSVEADLYICDSCKLIARQEALPRIGISLILFFAVFIIMVISPLLTGIWLLVEGTAFPSGEVWIMYVSILFVFLLPALYFRSSYKNPEMSFISIEWNANLNRASYGFKLKNNEYFEMFKTMNPILEVKYTGNTPSD